MVVSNQQRPLSVGRFLLASIGFAGLYASVTRVAESVFVAILMVGIGYLLAIYLYYGTTCFASAGRYSVVILAAVIALLITMAYETSNALSVSLFEVGRIFIVSALAGHFLARTDQPLIGFLAGALAMILLTLIQYGPHWVEIMEHVRAMSVETLAWMKASLKASGTPESTIEDTILGLKATTDMTARLIPAAVVLFALLQFALGYLWYLYRAISRGLHSSRVLDFTLWKMPYQVATLVIVSVATRLLGDESLQLITDNAIAILTVSYTVTGLALVEHGLRGLKLPIWFRVVFYIFLPFTGVIGMVIIAILGFIDSFVDWRKVAPNELDLKKK